MKTRRRRIVVRDRESERIVNNSLSFCFYVKLVDTEHRERVCVYVCYIIGVDETIRKRLLV